MLRSADFDLREYVERKLPAHADPEEQATLRAEAYSSSAWRRWATEDDPLLFALLYFPHHLRSDATGGAITLADVHLAWAERAKALAEPLGDDPERHADIAPRETGKSTWHFLVIPAWAAAHGHIKFAVAFADTSTQAETHLATFKHELETNALLRADYPDLVEPLRRERGVIAADRVSLYRARSGFVFAARGMDTSTLGLKVGAQRPDYIVLDDVEPDESRYGKEQRKKRLGTLQDAVLPLNNRARVQWVGTVTMPDSMTHDLVRAARGVPYRQSVKDPDWVRDDGWQPHYWPAIVEDDEGTERSLWPARWSLAYLHSIRHTRSYAKNYANDPLGADGDYWTLGTFRRAPLDGVTRTLLSIDPAVTTKDSSDYTGLAVIGWQPPARGTPDARGRCIVKRAQRVKLSGAGIRATVLRWLQDDPTIGLVLIETNQGGDVWREILYGLPVPLKTKQQSVKKEVRAAQVLNHYERGRVMHDPDADLAALEGEQVAFPNAANDDLVDAVGTGVAYFLNRALRKANGGARTTGYAA